MVSPNVIADFDVLGSTMVSMSVAGQAPTMAGNGSSLHAAEVTECWVFWDFGSSQKLGSVTKGRNFVLVTVAHTGQSSFVYRTGVTICGKKRGKPCPCCGSHVGLSPQQFSSPFVESS